MKVCIGVLAVVPASLVRSLSNVTIEPFIQGGLQFIDC